MSSHPSWILQSVNRQKVLSAFSQPLTPRQLAKKTGIHRDACSSLLAELSKTGFVTCLTPDARRSRLYGLTPQGLSTQQEVPHQAKYNQPALDWKLYGWLCYSQRSAVLLALDRLSRPSELRSRARLRNPEVTINTSNVRDILRLFLAEGLVRHVQVKRYVHLRYELTDLGRVMRELLLRGEAG